MANEIKFNSGVNSCNDRIAIVKNEVVPRRLKETSEIEETTTIESNDYIFVDRDGSDKKIQADVFKNLGRVQSDWSEEDDTAASFIKNKPDISNVCLQKDVTSIYNVGGIHVGDFFEAYTPIYKIVERMLSLDPNQRTFRFGLTKTNPSLLTAESLGNIPVRELSDYDISNGYELELDFNNDYFVVAIPNTMEVEVESIMQGGWKIGYTSDSTTVEGTTMYYYSKTSTGKFTLIINFKKRGA